jgi:hypothetical protein
MRDAPAERAEVARQRTDICPARAGNGDIEITLARPAAHHPLVNRDASGAKLERRAPARRVVGANAIDLLGRIRGRHLLEGPGERREDGTDCLVRGHGGRLGDDAGGVVGIGARAEPDRRVVHLWLALKIGGEPRHPADEQHQQPRRKWVQRSQVPDATNAEDSTRARDGIVRGEPGALVDEEQSLNQGTPRVRSSHP